MAYRITTVHTIVADDSELNGKFYERKAVIYQSLDQETVVKRVRVGTADADTEVDITPITAGKYLEVRSDYPVKVRVNGVAETQLVGVGQGVAAVNQGAPLPDRFVYLFTGNVSSVYLEPIASAGQTANVSVIVTGDPVSDYTGG